ncbi:hypothetical protein ACIBQ5_11225 [Streptomyces massasporeus]|uniref:hypothetical protein n=1 Tax=Streptomyces massasporeus TaxID=67324 RepID=UPI00379575E8
MPDSTTRLQVDQNVVPGAAEVGYWTAERARGRAIAPRALRALTDWTATAS